MAYIHKKLYVYLDQYVYLFQHNFPPVCLFGQVRLLGTLEYMTYMEGSTNLLHSHFGLYCKHIHQLCTHLWTLFCLYICACQLLVSFLQDSFYKHQFQYKYHFHYKYHFYCKQHFQQFDLADRVCRIPVLECIQYYIDRHCYYRYSY